MNIRNLEPDTYDLNGIDKIFDKKADFKWNQIDRILNVEYKVITNELCEDIADFTVKNMSKYSQITGFEIIDNRARGWENEHRYQVSDYEEGMILILCKDITILSVG